MIEIIFHTVTRIIFTFGSYIASLRYIRISNPGVKGVEENLFGQLATMGILFVAPASSNNEHANDRPKIDIGAIRIFLRLAVLRARTVPSPPRVPSFHPLG